MDGRRSWLPPPPGVPRRRRLAHRRLLRPKAGPTAPCSAGLLGVDRRCCVPPRPSPSGARAGLRCSRFASVGRTAGVPGGGASAFDGVRGVRTWSRAASGRSGCGRCPGLLARHGGWPRNRSRSRPGAAISADARRPVAASAPASARRSRGRVRPTRRRSDGTCCRSPTSSWADRASPRSRPDHGPVGSERAGWRDGPRSRSSPRRPTGHRRSAPARGREPEPKSMFTAHRPPSRAADCSGPPARHRGRSAGPRTGQAWGWVFRGRRRDGPGAGRPA